MVVVSAAAILSSGIESHAFHSRLDADELCSGSMEAPRAAASPRSESPPLPLVQIRNLAVNYGKTRAVEGISFDIPRGAIFGFIGPNGAGKTSTIKVLATLLRPAAGKVLVCGYDVLERANEVRRKIGYLPDAFGVYDDLTAEEYLHFFAAAYHAMDWGASVADALDASRAALQELAQIG